MSTNIKLALAAVIALAATAALADVASAAPHHRRAWQSEHGAFIQRPVALPSYGYARGGRFSGPFRTDSAPINGGGY